MLLYKKQNILPSSPRNEPKSSPVKPVKKHCTLHFEKRYYMLHTLNLFHVFIEELYRVGGGLVLAHR